MNKTKHWVGKLGIALCAGVMAALTGCVVGPRHGVVYTAPPPDYLEAGVVVQDDYFYYPNYQVYYSSNRRQYVYQEGNAWVTRPAPPRVAVDVLHASPSVRLDFHDAPASHHATVVKQYPKNWRSPQSRPNHEDANHDNRKNNNRKDPR